MGEEAKQPQPPAATPQASPTRGRRVPAHIRVSVDPLEKSQFVQTKEVEAWRDRLAWDDRVTAPFQPVDVPCVPGQGLPRERPMFSPAREWGQMSARQAHRSSAGWGCGVGSMLSKQAAPTLSTRAMYHPPSPFRRPKDLTSNRRQQPLHGKLIKGSQASRGNSSLLWGENGRDDRNVANWCSHMTAVHQRDGTPASTAQSRVFVFDKDFVPVVESNSYKALSARIEQHHTTIVPPPRTPTSPSHREGSWMSRGHSWNLERGWRPTSSGPLFG